jgi:hypothetical protein
MLAVVATMPPTLICAVGVKITPARFEMITCPFEDKFPARTLASGPTTCCSEIEPVPG